MIPQLNKKYNILNDKKFSLSRIFETCIADPMRDNYPIIKKLSMLRFHAKNLLFSCKYLSELETKEDKTKIDIVRIPQMKNIITNIEYPKFLKEANEIPFIVKESIPKLKDYNIPKEILTEIYFIQDIIDMMIDNKRINKQKSLYKDWHNEIDRERYNELVYELNLSNDIIYTNYISLKILKVTSLEDIEKSIK